ncbi:MAG TPA: WYL domain-containing protein [Phototrophicaceae bacterium]|nr:WYL domain-containing protein [Phototrophicaceae bacterium]
MRADRLLSILMRLQSQGQTSAQALADELGVSVRTIYRDMDALAEAGIPLYAEYGADGGYRLVEEYRTALTGLTTDELHSLLLLKIPEPLAALDTGAKLKAALLKLRAASVAYPAQRAPAQPSVYLDWAWWGQRGSSAPQLQTLYQAIQRSQKVRVRYVAVNGALIERVIEPYGLVAKAGLWYLVCGGAGCVRYYAVTEIGLTEITGDTFQRPTEFDLEMYWKAVCTRIERDSLDYQVIARVAPAMCPWLSRFLQLNFQPVLIKPGTTDAEGWTQFELYFDSIYTARTLLLGLGGAVEVIEPEALRLSMQNFAEQISQLYQQRK